MQCAQLRAGDAVRIRGERWRIAADSPYDTPLIGGVSIVDVDGCDPSNRGIRARFILPFEPLERLPTSPASPRMVSLARWRHAVRATLAAALPHWTSLRAAAHADLTIVPFQLEPALAVTRGDACRLLIADDVGLGKTIQAGLIVAETVTRTPDARVLIVAPAGLRDQWRDELRLRFSLNPEVLDAGGIARAGSRLAPDVNPWSVHPIAIASIDFVKRPDVLRSLEALLWDVIVFDEAHTLGGRSERGTAATALAVRARCVVMLTATPHSGDEDAFARLCGVGDLGATFPLMTFRRTRADVGLPDARRSILLRIRPTAAELAMHRALGEYAQLIAQQTDGAASGPAAGLVATILMRRACSSASSLARSLQRRMALLAEASAPQCDQLTLPFTTADDDDEPDAELGIAGLRDTGEERRWLERLLSLAREASLGESKLRALQRFLARANEPALVFTEYRDTLQHLAAALAGFDPLQLHGGLTRPDRGRVLRQFAEAGSRVLLATDAASEGLNLHHRCRLVVNLELPWTPLRLEQRIGRVDRLGQRRRVHAVQLIAAGSGEEAGVSRFAGRTERIVAALEAARAANASHSSPLRHVAEAEAARLQLARALSANPETRHGVSPPIRPVVTSVRRPGALRGRTWALRLPIVDAAGHLVFETIVGLHDARGPGTMDDLLDEIAAASHRRVLAAVSTSIGSSLHLMTRREKAIIDALRMRHARLSAGLLQPGLFDRRAERAATAQTSLVDAAVQKSIARLALFDRLSDLREDSRSIVFGIDFR
jgi:superfamily II DNA or RNA helicase